jgi:hypothetical protein
MSFGPSDDLHEPFLTSSASQDERERVGPASESRRIKKLTPLDAEFELSWQSEKILF